MHGSSLRHSPPGDQRNFKGIRRTGKARYGWQRPKIPAVKKLRHEDFKTEASLYNFANTRPAGLQQGNFALKMLKKGEKNVLEVWVGGRHLNSTTHKARLSYKSVGPYRTWRRQNLL